MKNLMYFTVIPCLLFISSFYFWGCDAAEDYAEQQMYIADTTIVQIDTIRTRTEIKFVPVKFDLAIQLASFARRDYAESMSEKADLSLSKKTEVIIENNYYVVIAGKFTDAAKAKAYLEYVKDKGFPEAFVKKIIRLDNN